MYTAEAVKYERPKTKVMEMADTWERFCGCEGVSPLNLFFSFLLLFFLLLPSSYLLRQSCTMRPRGKKKGRRRKREKKREKRIQGTYSLASANLSHVSAISITLVLGSRT